MQSLKARLTRLAKSEQLRRFVTIAVLLSTIGVFVYFFTKHPQYIRILRHINPLTVLLLLGLNALLIIVLVFIYDQTLQLCGKRLGFKENLLLTSYSAIANFFGPLQSGPGVRAVYLKTRHHVRLRDYTLATLLYYAIFATINAFFLFAGSFLWWQTALALTAVVVISYSVINAFTRRANKSNTRPQLQFKPSIVGKLCVATLTQICLLIACYFVELRVIDAHITLHQTIIYSAAANFALFVSLTPDAIGFRESFLVLAKRLHHIGTATILAANIIDRAVYPIFLGLLFIPVVFLHVKDRLRLKESRP